jgi:hypothetical protein
MYNLTSGRNLIWAYYLNMIADSSMVQLLFGRGAVWEYGDFEFEGHNDALNLVICYGLFGTALVVVVWTTILSRLESAYRAPCIILFLTLFLTNGVIFHQSNVLLLLFVAGRSRVPVLSPGVQQIAMSQPPAIAAIRPDAVQNLVELQ